MLVLFCPLPEWSKQLHMLNWEIVIYMLSRCEEIVNTVNVTLKVTLTNEVLSLKDRWIVISTRCTVSTIWQSMSNCQPKYVKNMFVHLSSGQAQTHLRNVVNRMSRRCEEMDNTVKVTLMLTLNNEVWSCEFKWRIVLSSTGEPVGCGGPCVARFHPLVRQPTRDYRLSICPITHVTVILFSNQNNS